MGRKQDKKTPNCRPAEGRARRHLLALAILAASVFIAYSSALNGTWALDDVVANKPVGIKDIHDFIGPRKIAYMTFLLNQHIAPFSPAGFRVFNIFLHILNVSLVYLLAYKTMSLFTAVPGKTAVGRKNDASREITSVAPDDKAFYAAFLSSALFALHPININAVSYIVQRMASLATLFVLLSLLCYIYAAGAGKLKASLLYVSGIISLLAGVFSKENAVLAVPLVLLYDYVFLSGLNHKALLKKAFFAVVAAFSGLGIASYFLGFYSTFLEIAKLFLNPNQPLTDKAWTAVDVYWTPLQHVLTEFRVVSRYIFLIFAPIPQFFVFDLWGLPVSTGITAPVTTLLSGLMLSSLAVFSVLKTRRFPLLCFGILWYLVSISLESFFAPGSDLYFEHRNYLPVSGLFVGFAGQIAASSRGRFMEKAAWPTAIAVCVVLGSLTFARNFVWKDSVTLWEDTLKKNPSNIRAMMALGNAYLRLSDLDNSERYYKEALKLSSEDKRLHFLDSSVYSLGMLYLLKGSMQPAKELIERFDYIMESNRPKILKGYYKALNNDVDGALRDYNDVVGKTENIDTIVVLTLMGDAYREKGMWDQAVEKYSGAIAQDPGFSPAHYGLGMAYLGKRNINLASEYIDKALQFDPANILALSDKAELMLITKARPEDALGYARKAVLMSPPFYQPYLAMGNILVVLGREKEAEDYYRKAAGHNAPAYMVSFSKARAYYIKGDIAMTNRYLAELRSYKDLPEKIKDIIR